MERVDKVIVTSLRRLTKKYDAAGVASILVAIKHVIEQDRTRRQLTTRLICLDLETEMAPFGGPIPVQASNLDFKSAVDRVYFGLKPQFIVLLGDEDVIPHQTLICRIPKLERYDAVPSDLPYASDAPADAPITRHIDACRIVGRIPDLPSTEYPADASFLRRVLEYVANASPRPRDDFTNAFAITSAEWEEQSRRTVRSVFKSGTQLNLIPPAKPDWPEKVLARAAHFINCHGADNDPSFSGRADDGSQLQSGLNASRLLKFTALGTVVAAECCFGAATFLTKDEMSIACAYLKRGATAYLGATTSTQGGDKSENRWADDIARLFLEHVLRGETSGEALARARLEYVKLKTRPLLDPLDYRTLAAFILLGDPSTTPVRIIRGPSLLPRPIDTARLRTLRTLSMERLRSEWRRLQPKTLLADFEPDAKEIEVHPILREEVAARGWVNPVAWRYAVQSVGSYKENVWGAAVSGSDARTAVHVVVAASSASVDAEDVYVLADETGDQLSNVRMARTKGRPDCPPLMASGRRPVTPPLCRTT
jgi:hypothetical protein